MATPEQTDKPQPEPECVHGFEHYWFMMGIEDNGDTAYRCGTCMTRKYVSKNGKVRYDVPEE